MISTCRNNFKVSAEVFCSSIFVQCDASSSTILFELIEGEDLLCTGSRCRKRIDWQVQRSLVWIFYYNCLQLELNITANFRLFTFSIDVACKTWCQCFDFFIYVHFECKYFSHRLVSEPEIISDSRFSLGALPNVINLFM